MPHSCAINEANFDRQQSTRGRRNWQPRPNTPLADTPIAQADRSTQPKTGIDTGYEAPCLVQILVEARAYCDWEQPTVFHA